MTAPDLASFDEPLRTVTWGLLACFAASLPVVLITALHNLWRGPRQAPRWSRDGRPVVAAALCAGLVARLFVPSRLVMHYMGYELLEQARVLGTTPKYGPASFQLQHVIMQVLEPTHQAVIIGHRLMSACIAIMCTAWVLRLGFSGRSVVWTAVLTALTPLLVHDAATESLLVEATLWATGAAWLLSRFLRSGAVIDGLLMVIWSLLAMLARPEMLVTVPLLLAATVWLADRPLKLRWPLIGVLVGAAAMVLWWRIEQMSAALVIERARGNTPRVFQEGHLALAGQLLRNAWWDKNGLLWPRIFPAVTTFAIVTGLLLATAAARRRMLVLAALTLAWLLPTALDLPYVSVTRVQAPAMLLASVTAGVAMAVVHGCLHAIWPRSKLTTVGILIGGLWLATAALTVPALWRTGPPHIEEITMRAAAAALPDGRATIVARSHDDLPDERVHLAMPKRSWGQQKRVGRLGWLLNGKLRPSKSSPVYAWLGTRCFMRPCSEKAEHPACARIRRRFQLQPIVTSPVAVQDDTIPSAFGRQRPRHPGAVADLDFPWCFTQQAMTIGLYRVVAPSKR